MHKLVLSPEPDGQNQPRANMSVVSPDAYRKKVCMSRQSPSSSERRSFLTRLNAGAASLAAMAFGGVAMAQQKSTAAARWEPARHEKDDWLDQLPGKHRLVFDTTAHDGLAEAILFANNFIRVNRADYGLQNNDLAVVIVVRHRSTPFGYNDAMWAKYGTAIAARAKVESLYNLSALNAKLVDLCRPEEPGSKAKDT